MSYHPIMGIIIFLVTIIISFLLGKNAFKKFRNNEKKASLSVIKSKDKTTFTKLPKGDIKSPDAPWLRD